ncbi:hypothetical protein [Mesorhizobium retamae]|uniref:Uncharacterized protein n=1 Tax=Mesorhizobium retamae TaxID=2912854 RepID=A0ABS9QBH0_9HYPH|nr:hypothetical protein [Mesorhizobium sp. IRAMC:0171]MCG7504766.1 hypothetical protein [Mesorhizobium sp. IRAMC:0171]
MITIEEATPSPATLHTIATPELSYVGNDAYHWTVIEISTGDKKSRRGHVRIHKNQYHHFWLEFIGLEAPAELAGSYTTNQGALHALRDCCEKHGWTLGITHISKDGKKSLRANLKAI